MRIARRDFSALSEAAALFSSKLWDVPEQIRKNVEEIRALRKQKDEALEQLAELMAASELRSAPETNGRKIVAWSFTDRDINFAKLFAQKVTRSGSPAVALVASTVDSPGLVFAQTAGGSSADMGALLKQTLASVGGRGGGTLDFAQGGIPMGSDVAALLRQTVKNLRI